MISSSHLQFLQQKIEEVKSALFFSEDDNVLKLPNCVITAHKVDDEGYIWFLVNRPLQQVDSFAKEFPARLNFFRKEKNYSIEVNGTAFLIDEEEETRLLAEQPALSDIDFNESMLVKIKMNNAKYFERETENQEYSIGYFLKKIQNWIFEDQHSYRPYTIDADNLRIA